LQWHPTLEGKKRKTILRPGGGEEKKFVPQPGENDGDRSSAARSSDLPQFTQESATVKGGGQKRRGTGKTGKGEGGGGRGALYLPPSRKTKGLGGLKDLIKIQGGGTTGLKKAVQTEKQLGPTGQRARGMMKGVSEAPTKNKVSETSEGRHVFWKPALDEKVRRGLGLIEGGNLHLEKTRGRGLAPTNRTAELRGWEGSIQNYWDFGGKKSKTRGKHSETCWLGQGTEKTAAARKRLRLVTTVG